LRSFVRLSRVFTSHLRFNYTGHSRHGRHRCARLLAACRQGRAYLVRTVVAVQCKGWCEADI
jgi:hypothetical protein